MNIYLFYPVNPVLSKTLLLNFARFYSHAQFDVTLRGSQKILTAPFCVHSKMTYKPFRRNLFNSYFNNIKSIFENQTY